MEKVWFISDTHFNHDKIIKCCNRPFDNVNTMNETIIHNWNNCINKNDRVYIIGDFAFSNHENFIKKLHGKKHLILGNHDGMSRALLDRFESVSQIKEVEFKDRTFVMCHYPLRTWNECQNGSVLLYGHCHGREESNNLSFDVGVDNHDFKPYSYEEIMEMVFQREEIMKRNHRIVYNKNNNKLFLQFYQDDVQYWKFLYKKASEKK